MVQHEAASVSDDDPLTNGEPGGGDPADMQDSESDSDDNGSAPGKPIGKQWRDKHWECPRMPFTRTLGCSVPLLCLS